MPRGKASVHIQDGTVHDSARILDHRAGVAIFAERQGRDAGACARPAPAGESELSEQIEGQLRAAYDELLSAPVPEHLQSLVASLLEQEGQS